VLRDSTDQHGPTSSSLTCQHIALRVADHPRRPEIDLELLGCFQNQSRPRLTASASGGVVVRAVPEQLDLAALVGEKLAYSFFHRTQCCEVEKPARDSALVRDDCEDVAGTSQSGGALGRTW
jgi:hypothetical protein